MRHTVCVPEKTKASFVPPMLLLRTDKLPEGANWLNELKLEGLRSIAFKSSGKVYPRSQYQCERDYLTGLTNGKQ